MWMPREIFKGKEIHCSCNGLHGVHEAKLFSRLVLEMPLFDDVSMAVEWCKHVNGISIFPKLPVYLRMYYERWERNQRVRDAVRNSQSEIQLLELCNRRNTLLSNGATFSLLHQPAPKDNGEQGQLQVILDWESSSSFVEEVQHNSNTTTTTTTTTMHEHNEQARRW